MSNKNMKVVSDEKRGLIAGYKPNRISLYILMLTTGRHEELMKVLYKDMEEYKIKEKK